MQVETDSRVAAGGALAVDRDTFSAEVTRRVEECPNITVHRQPVEHIDESAPILVATGPLTDGKLADEIGALTGDERLHFYDAVAPIVTAESLDYNKVFAASRYGRGDADYLNCPFNKVEYEAFHAALAAAERGDVVLSGHTHIPRGETVDGVHFWNPGSTTLPKGGFPASYGVFEVGAFRVFGLDGRLLLEHRPSAA